MADFKMHHAVLVFAVIGLYNVRVIHMAEADIESKVDYLEYRLDRLLKNEIAALEDNLRTIQNDKADNACCKTGQQQVLNKTSADGIQRLVNDVTAKITAMLIAFSTEKKQLRRQRTYLNEALGVIRGSVADHENQTLNAFRVTFEDHKTQSLNLVEQLENKHRVDFEKLTNKIELVGRQSQQKCDSMQHLVEKHSSDIDTMKSNIDGMKKAKHCKEGWIRQLDSCVLYVDTKKTWFNAQDHCNDLGGFLAEPYSPYAFFLLVEEKRPHLSLFSRGNTRWWIGASDQAKEGVWRWETTGYKLGKVPTWNSGEPNDEDGEDCAELLFGVSAMNDKNCGINSKFICEIKL